MAARKEPGAEEFGRLLKTRREELGLSRRDVVEASGLSYPYVSQLETGYRLPSHKALAALAEALELPPNELSASIPYGEALATSSNRRAPRRSRSVRSAEQWYGNPRYAEPAAAARPPALRDPRRVAQHIADLVAELPREQRLHAFNLAQRQVLDELVADELEDRGGS